LIPPALQGLLNDLSILRELDWLRVAIPISYWYGLALALILTLLPSKPGKAAPVVS
jgi:hypothetical protein